jgi:D-3-phosphoglycerate dehydrogenase
MPRVLIADQLSPAAVKIFADRGVEADTKTGLSKDELLKIIDQYDGLAVRSATKADKDVIAAAKRLKVIGRAGIGVDNVDIPAATAAGMVVMNTPFGNSITTAEHAIALIFALARQVPEANLSTLASGRRTASWAWSFTQRPSASSVAAISAASSPTAPTG